MLCLYDDAVTVAVRRVLYAWWRDDESCGDKAPGALLLRSEDKKYRQSAKGPPSAPECNERTSNIHSHKMRLLSIRMAQRWHSGRRDLAPNFR
jgi:hypothetical protein